MSRSRIREAATARVPAAKPRLEQVLFCCPGAPVRAARTAALATR